MSKRLRALSVLVALAGIGGCKTLSKNECLAADWQTIGYEDGVAGYTGDRVALHRKACAKYGVAPDLTLYQAGRQEGLHEFCQPANGFQIGSRGYTYTGVCAGELEPAFVASYDSGHHLYVLQSRVSDAVNQIDGRRGELNDIDDTVAKKSAAIVSDKSTEEERAQALADIKHLTERAGKLKTEIRQWEEDRVNRQRDLDEYRASLAAGG